MLKFFSRMERTKNFVLIAFVLVLVLGMVFFAASIFDFKSNEMVLTRSDETVAKVGDEKITVGEIATIIQSRGGKIPAKLIINPLISQRLTRIEAERLGLVASDAEVAGYIRQNFKEEGKPFDQNRYEQTAISQAGSVTAFEQSIRDSLSGQKLEAYLTSGVTISEEEVLKDYQRKNTKFDVSYVPVSAADLAQTIKPSDDELKSHFEQNKKNYFISVPQKKIRYVFLNSSKVGEKLTVSDEDLKAEFEKIPADKKIKGVEGQEIVLRIAKPEFESQVLGKASELVAQARKDGGKISAEAFAALAKGQSENPVTAQNGGKLSGLVRENPANPTDPYQQLLKMQPGDVSEPVSYQGRYFILRRGEAVPKTFEDAKQELTISLKNRRSDTAALSLSQKVNDRLKEVKDVQKVADEFAGEANMSAKDMVRETGFIKPGDNIENVGISPDFEKGIELLVNPGDVGEKFRIKDGFAIPLLVEKKEPRDAEFSEVKDRVAEDYKLQQAQSRVEEIAKQIAAAANSAGDLANAATSKGLKAQEQKSFILGSPLGTGPSAATSEALEEAVYNLKNGEVTKTPVKVNDNWYIVGATKREEANMEDFAKQRDKLINQKLSEKRGQVYADYLAAVKQQMESKKEIQIYQEAFAKLESLAQPEPQMPQMPQGFPQGMPIQQ